MGRFQAGQVSRLMVQPSSLETLASLRCQEAKCRRLQGSHEKKAVWLIHALGKIRQRNEVVTSGAERNLNSVLSASLLFTPEGNCFMRNETSKKHFGRCFRLSKTYQKHSRAVLHRAIEHSLSQQPSGISQMSPRSLPRLLPYTSPEVQPEDTTAQTPGF